MPAWKTIPLFISSTFRDMHAERGHLHDVVFPALEERLRERRCRLEPIDLRIGVESDATKTEREREIQILKVCLAEIERSRPFLLVLLGDRYGWVPSADRSTVAAGEAGFATDTQGKSVTALEIEFGLLKKDPLQRRRSLLCLREPLPYYRMDVRKAAIFSDAHGTDPDAPERVRRLNALKARIVADPELADHRLNYHLDWNVSAAHPETNSLATWGAEVQAHLWRQLDDETRDRVGATEPTWQDEERYAIEEMVERLNASFVGRTNLVTHALALATSPTAEGTPWGQCFTGDSGCGKSALFARLHHELDQRKDLLLLSHAAGITPRAGQTGDMLRRWAGELAAALGEPAPELPEDLKPEDLEKQFASLLARTSATRRVIVLVDALNQFVRTDRARTVAWLPVLWPANARFLATAISGDETKHLARRPGFSLTTVPLLSAIEADGIAVQVYGRYHRRPNANLMAALMAKRLSDGTVAAGSPLWLTLALDLLNLIDADDLTAAETSAEGTSQEKLFRYLRARVDSLPLTVEDLYAHLLGHIEKVVGIGETRAFAALLALSRHGWREDDLRHLMHRAAEILVPHKEARNSEAPEYVNRKSPIENPKSSWDPLRFAILRRLFRAHLVKRGALEQWDLAHTRLRIAVRQLLDTAWRSAGKDKLVPDLYAIGATYLESAPEAAPVRSDEIMWQMLGTRDAVRVANHYAQPTSSSQNLARYLSEESTMPGHPVRTFVLSLLECPSLTEATTAAIAERFNSDLHDALEKEGHLLLRTEVLRTSRAAIKRLVETDPSNADWQHDLAMSDGRIGVVLFDQGDLSTALGAFRDCVLILQRLVEAEPYNAARQRDLASAQCQVGTMLQELGDLNGALQAYRLYQMATERLADTDPASAGWQHDLALSHCKIGDLLHAQGDLSNALKAFSASHSIFQRLADTDPANTGWQRDFSVSHNRIGDVFRAQGDLSSALQAFRNSLDVIQRLADSDPANVNWQRDLCVSHDRIVDVLCEQGDYSSGLKGFQTSLALRKRLTETEPANASWQLDLSMSYNRIGEVLRGRGDLPDALDAFRNSLTIRKRLSESDPANARWQREFASAQCYVGMVLQDLGELNGALEAYRLYQTGMERLAELDPTNAGWQRDLAISYGKIGEALRNRGDLIGSLKASRDSLAIAQRLAELDPTNASRQFDLGVSHELIGSVLQDQGDLNGALAAFRRKQETVQHLCEADPANARLQHDLALSHYRIGEVLRDQGNLADALKAFRDSLAVAQRMAAADPGNASWQNSLSLTHINIGDVLLAQGDLVNALKIFRDSLATTKRLTELDPANASSQRDLFVSHVKIGEVLRDQGNLADALKALRDSLAVAHCMAAARPANAGWQRDLAVSHHKIATIAKQQGDHVTAFAELEECFTVLDGMRQRHMQLDPPVARIYSQLAALFSGGRAFLGTHSLAASQPNNAVATKAPPPKELQPAEMLASAERSYLKGNLDAAMTMFEKTFAQGAPASSLAANWVACLLGVHAKTAIPALHFTKAKAILEKLVAEGQQSLAADLDRRIQSHQQAAVEAAKPEKPRWKIW